MNTNNTYKLLTAAITFRDAYTNLCKLYNQYSDADFTEQYPLGQIDLFDENTCNGITAWLNCQTTKLINDLPDRVINPACISCLLIKKKEFGFERPVVVKLRPNGSCETRSDDSCILYPFVVFDPPAIKRFLMAQEYDPTIRLESNVTYDDTALRVLYNKLLEHLNIKEF